MNRDGAKSRGITERVQFKFVLSFCALLAGLIVLLNTYPIAASRDLVASEKESSLLSQASVISSSLSTLSPLEPESVGQVMDLLELSSSGRIVVTDELGIILYDTGSPSGKGKAAMLAEVALALEGKQVFHSVFSGGAFVSTAAMPVRAGGVTLGAVYVQEYDTAQAELILSIQNRLVTISIAASVAALALTVVFSRALTRRITRLAEAIRVVRGGDYAHRLKPEGNDELTELCEEFNNMTQTLETTEQQRRRFVSDASHELKTPLAAIRLLADSIEQNADMDEATMREFVSDIGTEADRLQRTTEKLLDLSRRDDGVQAARVPVDLGEVARSTLRLLSPLVYTKIAPRYFYRGALLSSAALFLVFLLVPMPDWAAAAITGVMGLLQGATVPTLVIICCDVFPERTASATSIVVFGVSLASMTSPAAMGAVIASAGAQAAMLSVTACTVVAALALPRRR